MPILSALASVAAAVLAGCGSEGRESAKPGERGPEFFTSALESLDKAEDLVRQAVLATCDKWQPRDRPCDPEQVRRDQLECWIDKGVPIQKYVEARAWRPRARARRVLLEVNLCMEQRRWRKITPGRDL
jgi:hypothetical protein